MRRPIGLFTDFGHAGPYLGQVRGVLLRHAPQAPVIDLMADAPAFRPRAAAYLLAALAAEWPEDMVVMAVIDPGVGGDRLPLIAEIDGRWFVGPDNGLFAVLSRRAARARVWAVTWRPERLSASFHGRDLFAPVAARLSRGETPEAIGAEAVPRHPADWHPADWPDDLPEVIYGDVYGNAWTGLRTATMPPDARLLVAGRVLTRARTFADRPHGEAFWYGNSCNLVEIAVTEGSAMDVLGLALGAQVGIQVNVA